MHHLGDLAAAEPLKDAEPSVFLSASGLLYHRSRDRGSLEHHQGLEQNAVAGEGSTADESIRTQHSKLAVHFKTRQAETYHHMSGFDTNTASSKYKAAAICYGIMSLVGFYFFTRLVDD